MKQIPWGPLITALVLLLPLLRQPLDDLLRTGAALICRVCGPDPTGKGESLADFLAVIGRWLRNSAGGLKDQHELTIGKFVGGLMLILLFLAAAAIESTLMRAAIEIILPIGDETMNILGIAQISSAFALALAVLMFEAGVATVFLEAASITDMFGWKKSWTSGVRKTVVAVTGITLLGLIVVQCLLANLRMEEAGLSSMFTSLQSVDTGESGNANAFFGEGATGDPTASVGKLVGIILSAMIPLFSVAGGYGIHQVLLGGATLLISLASGASYVAAGGSWLTSTASRWSANASCLVLNLSTQPGKWLIEITDQVITISWKRQP